MSSSETVVINANPASEDMFEQKSLAETSLQVPLKNRVARV